MRMTRVWSPATVGVAQVIANMGFGAYARYRNGEGSNRSKLLALAGALSFMVSDAVLAVSGTAEARALGKCAGVCDTRPCWCGRCARGWQVNKFRFPFVGAKTIVMVTYFA